MSAEPRNAFSRRGTSWSPGWSGSEQCGTAWRRWAETTSHLGWMPTPSSCLGSAACEVDHSSRHQRDVIRVVDDGPLTSTGRGSATTGAWPAIDAGSTQKWLVHPRRAHPPTKQESTRRRDTGFTPMTAVCASPSVGVPGSTPPSRACDRPRVPDPGLRPFRDRRWDGGRSASADSGVAVAAAPPSHRHVWVLSWSPKSSGAP